MSNPNDVNTQRFTLAQAERMLAVRNCAAGGHLPVESEWNNDFTTTPRVELYCTCGCYVWTPQPTSMPNWMTA